MDNLRSVLSIVLRKFSASDILKEKVRYDNLTKDKFVQIAGYYIKNYSNDELENLFSYMQTEYEETADYLRGFTKHSNIVEYFNIFDAILIFAVKTLQEMDGEPVCQYENMLRWRMTSHELDEDVFTTAFLAYRDVRYVNKNREFSWRPVIRHNNIYLNRILSQGMADNHFHLKGSAPQFPLSWISMMNDVTNVKFKRQLESYGKKRLSVIYATEDGEEHLYILYLKAALIRVFLFSKLLGTTIVLKERKDEENGDEERKKEEAFQRKTELFVIDLLQHTDEILFYRKQIQANIDAFKNYNMKHKKITEDYAINGHEEDDSVNGVLSGERWFMYTMYQFIFSKNKTFMKYYNLFYAYLVIKENIRSELVQTNSNIGFDNFEKYQDRKEDFIENTVFEKPYIEMAVKGTIVNQNIQSLEARISPKGTAEENRNYICKFENIFKKEDELKSRFFYVFHFIKEKDYAKSLGGDLYCRHYLKRNSVKKQALAIARFREKYSKVAQRVLGIDACAKEIECRPEVFSQTYRFLRNHIVYQSTFFGEKTPPVKQLSLTYHIGEDYVDIIDGLRALDETVYFLQLDCGSRIGHGLALGVDVDEYYKMKNNRVLIKQQDYLDNLVWLYYRIKKFKLNHYADLLLFIEQEYSKYFRIIYGNYINEKLLKEMVQLAKEHFDKKGEYDKHIADRYNNPNFYFRISEYYAAWKLRGDNPKCYIRGYFEEPDDFSEWDKYAVNRNYPEDYKVRYNPESAYLYYLYHYSAGAKEEGAKVIETRISHRMVMCIKEVQYEMQKWIAKLGIGIETNPSSNYMIGSFKRYDKHPIFKFYNLGLTVSQKELEECPQLSVCINTDDQGIFSTYLENEYALLALALEKAKDEDGNNKYNRTMIYQWIDNVRKQGIRLSFGDNKPELFTAIR